MISVWMGSHIHRPNNNNANDIDITAISGSDGSNAPWFDIPHIAELSFPITSSDGESDTTSSGSSGELFEYAGYTENLVPCHLLEIPENGSDVAHLPALHAPLVIPLLRPLLRHKWEATWRPHSSDDGDNDDIDIKGGGKGKPREWGPHIADITIEETIVTNAANDDDSRELPGSRVKVKITQCGPTQVYLQMRTPIGPITLVETVTPVHPLLQRVLHAAYIPKWMPLIVSKAVLWATLKQFEADVPIWSQKRYEPKPYLSAADKGIPQYRRWVSQFYDPKRGSSRGHRYPPAVSFAEASAQYARDLLGLTHEQPLSQLVSSQQPQPSQQAAASTGAAPVSACGAAAADGGPLSW